MISTGMLKGGWSDRLGGVVAAREGGAIDVTQVARAGHSLSECEEVRVPTAACTGCANFKITVPLEGEVVQR